MADWVGLATLAAAMTGVASLGVVVWQLRVLGRQTEEAARQTRLSAEATGAEVRVTLWREMIKTDRFFIDHPEQRTLIYGPSDTLGANLPSQQADAAAEMMTDLIECIMVHKRYFRGDIGGGWVRYIEDLLTNSETLQDFWRKNRTWYMDLQRYFDPVMAKLEKAKAAAVADEVSAANGEGRVESVRAENLVHVMRPGDIR